MLGVLKILFPASTITFKTKEEGPLTLILDFIGPGFDLGALLFIEPGFHKAKQMCTPGAHVSSF